MAIPDLTDFNHVLLKEPELFRHIFNTTQLGITIYSPDKGWLEANETFCNMLGYTREELFRLDFRDITHPDDVKEDRKLYLNLLAGNIDNYSLDKRYIKQDGGDLYAHVTIDSIRDYAGNMRYCIAFVRDITDRKQSELAVIQSEMKYRTLVEHSPYRIHEINRGLTNDVTENRLIQEKLLENEARLLNILDSMFIFVGILDLEGVLLYANRAALQRASLTQAEVIGKSLAETYWWSYSRKVQQRLRLALRKAAAGEIVRYDEQVRLTDDRFIVIDVTFGPLFNSSGTVTQLIGSAVDITERNRAEHALHTRSMQQSVIAQVGHFALQNSDIHRLMELIVSRLAGTLSVEYTKILEYFPASGDLLLRAGVGWDEGLVGNTRVSADIDSQAGYTMRVEHPVIVEDLGTETRFSGPPLLHAHNVISGMSVVIAGPDHPWGVLGVHTRQHRLFTREDTDFLRSMANILAEAIERYDADAEIQRYKDIVDTSVDLIAYVDNDYCYRAVNQPYLEFAGKPRDLVIGHTVEEVLGRDYFYNIAKSNIDRCLRGESVRVQRWIDMPDGSRVYEDATMNPERDETGEIKGMVFSGRDITGLKIMEEALQKSAWQLQEAQHIARMGFWEFDIIKDQHTWSDEIYSIFGVSRGDFIPNHENLATIIHPDDVKWVESERKKAVSTSNRIDYEYRINRRDSGEVRFVHVLGDVNRDEKNNPVRLFGTVLDITERKLAENKLTQSRERLRNLVIRLQAVREEERTLIAREIHDELGQGLTALKIDLSLLKSRLPAAWKKIPAHLQKMIAEIDSTIDYVRKLSSSLRPPILDDLGLDAAIEWQIQGFAARTKCDYSLDIQPSPYEYDYDRETAVFRIFQEALNNVARHANAGHVGVRLHYRGRFLLMNLVDNGVGISSEKISDPHSIGLIGMHERAAMFGGKVEISSVASGGTSVAVTLPFPEPSS